MYQAFTRAIFYVLFALIYTNINAQNGQYDLRFNVNDCDENKLYVDVEIKASSTATEFALSDQNYRFSFNRAAVANPTIEEELTISGVVPVGNDIALYSAHDMNGSSDTIVSLNIELLSSTGYNLPTDVWTSVGRLDFDIVDVTACVELTWHTIGIFPSIYIGEIVTTDNIRKADVGTIENLNYCLSDCVVTTAPPVANNDNIVVNAGTSGAFNVLSNDLAPSGASLNTPTVSTNIPASEGVLTNAGNGAFTFMPAAGFTGAVTPIDYEVCASNGLCAQATIFIIITGSAPTANDDNVTISAGTSGAFNVLSNDIAPSGANLNTPTILTSVPASEGVLTNIINGALTFMPAGGFTGNVSPINYEVCASNGLCAQATIFITVTGTAPTANDDNVTIIAGTSGTFNILNNDTPAPGSVIDAIILLTPPLASEGTLTIDSNTGLTTFTPTTDFIGTVAPIIYQICGTNGLCDQATIFITISPPPVANIAGTIYGKDGTTPLKDLDMTLSGDETSTYTVGTDGAYNFDVANGGDYTITPNKGGDIRNGVTSVDLAIAQGHIINLLDLGSPYDIIAMDVNQSCNLTSVDLAITQGVILRILDEFPEGKSWKFIPADLTFPDINTPCNYDQFLNYENITSDIAKQDFIGVKIGDVNGSYNPSGFVASAPMSIHIADRVAAPGTLINVPVSASDITNILTWQLTHSWNMDMLEFEGVEAVHEDLADGLLFSEHAIDAGKLTSLWLNPKNLSITVEEKAVLYELKFRVIGEAGTNTSISANSSITPMVAYKPNFEEIEIFSDNGLLEIQALTDIVEAQEQSNVLSFKNTPNPFHNKTNIYFELQHSSDINLLIYNILGKKVAQFEGRYGAGKHRIEWNNTQGYPAGVYTCELQSEHQREVIKMLISN